MIHPLQAMRRMMRRCLPSMFVQRLRDARTFVQLVANSFGDTLAFARHSGVFRARLAQSSLRALITMDYHAIEKGLALPAPRPGFGAKMVARLLEHSRQYLAQYGRDDLTKIVHGCLRAYLEFHREQPEAITALREPIDQLIAELGHSDAAGESAASVVNTHRAVLPLTRDELLENARIDGERFFCSRFSIRQFAPTEVDDETIRRAVRMAQKTPSVCNRQGGRVHLIRSRSLIDACLTLQGGARGFASQVNKLLICTTDTSSMVLVGERNQHWIDGGLFAMSLVYALHSLGLGTCFLNWSKTRDQDAALRRTCAIPRNERVVVMIAVGHLPEQLFVAESARRPLDTVLTIHDGPREPRAADDRALAPRRAA